MGVIYFIVLFPMVMSVNLDDVEYLEIDNVDGNLVSPIIPYYVML